MAAWLSPALLLFVETCFVLPTAPAYALVFYTTVLPCVLARLALGQAPRDPAFWSGVALIAWSGLTLLWGRDDGGRSGSMALAAACTLVFWYAAAVSLAEDAVRDRAARLIVWFGLVSATLGIARYFFWPAYVAAGQPKRLHGWGVASHPVLGAAVLSVCLLTALALSLREPWHRARYRAASAVIAMAIVLTKSRGPELAVLCGTLVLLAAGAARRWTPVLFAVVPLAWGLWWQGLLRTGDSGHFLVWRSAWAQIVARPWTGYGLAADLPARLGGDKSFPHDLYLSLLFYSGAIGLLLFALWAGPLIWRVARARGPDTAWLLALWTSGLIAGLTDFGQITKGPGPLWFVLWLPAALSLRASLPPAGGGLCPPAPPTCVPPASHIRQ